MLNRILLSTSAIALATIAYLYHRARLGIEIQHSQQLRAIATHTASQANEIIDNLDRSYQGAIFSHVTNHVAQTFPEEHAAEFAQRVCDSIKNESRTRFSLLTRANSFLDNGRNSR